MRDRSPRFYHGPLVNKILFDPSKISLTSLGVGICTTKISIFHYIIHRQNVKLLRSLSLRAGPDPLRWGLSSFDLVCVTTVLFECQTQI